MRRSILIMGFCLTSIRFLWGQQIQLVTPELIDLGKIHEGSAVQGHIRFVNSGKIAVTIESAKPGCGCTVAEIQKKELAPGDTGTILFSLNTKNFHGIIRKSLAVYFKESGVNDLHFSIQANVYSDLDVVPRYIHFQRIKINPDTVLRNSFMIQNHSERLVRVKEISATSNLIHLEPHSVEIPPGKEQSVDIEFRPRVKDPAPVEIILNTDLETIPQIRILVFVNYSE